MVDQSNDVRRVIFVCVENANRSQMAEAWARMFAQPGLEVFSAGSKPAGRVNAKAVEAMSELGYDLAAHRSKSIDELSGTTFDVVVTMGCGDACPQLRARRREEWTIPDPREMPPAEFRAVRDMIGEKVREFMSSL